MSDHGFHVAFNCPSSYGPFQNDFRVLCGRICPYGTSVIRSVVLDFFCVSEAP